MSEYNVEKILDEKCFECGKPLSEHRISPLSYFPSGSACHTCLLFNPPMCGSCIITPMPPCKLEHEVLVKKDGVHYMVWECRDYLRDCGRVKLLEKYENE